MIKSTNILRLFRFLQRNPAITEDRREEEHDTAEAGVRNIIKNNRLETIISQR